jgi:hypothetical protein
MAAILAVVLALAQLPYMRQALELGRSQDAALIDAFAKGYQLTSSENVDSAEVITEFRRAVIITREQMRLGQASFSAVDLAREMTPHEGQVSFVVQARLHPMNTYSAAPPYEMYVSTGAATPPLVAKPLKRDPVYPIGSPSSLIGVRLEGTFSRDEVLAAAAPTLVVTDDKANVLWKARIDLSRYR